MRPWHYGFLCVSPIEKRPVYSSRTLFEDYSGRRENMAHFSTKINQPWLKRRQKGTTTSPILSK
jgi:hypothetical protein